MKNFIWYFFLFIYLSLFSCNDGRLDESELKKAKIEVIKKGDKRSYNEILFYYEDLFDYESTFSYSIVMAYKYNDADAYYYLYQTMIRINSKGAFHYNLIKNLNSDSKKFAIDNLKKSSELGNIDAKVCLIKYYKEGKYLPQNIDAAKVLENQIKKWQEAQRQFLKKLLSNSKFSASSKLIRRAGIAGAVLTVGNIGLDVAEDGAIKASSLIDGGSLAVLGVATVFCPPCAVVIGAGVLLYGVLDYTFEINDAIDANTEQIQIFDK